MIADAETFQFLFLLIMTLVLTIVDLNEERVSVKSVILSWLTSISWFASAYAQFVSADISDAITIPLIYLFLAFGFIFAFSGIMTTMQLASKRKVRI